MSRVPSKIILKFIEERVEPLFEGLVRREMMVSLRKDPEKPTIVDVYTKVTAEPNLLGSTNFMRHTDRVVLNKLGKPKRIDRSNVSIKVHYMGYDFRLLVRTEENAWNIYYILSYQ